MGRLPLTLSALASVASVVSVTTLRPGRIVSHAPRSNVFVAVLDPAEWFRETFAA